MSRPKMVKQIRTDENDQGNLEKRKSKLQSTVDSRRKTVDKNSGHKLHTLMSERYDGTFKGK
jgi:hypothetical protein